MQTQTEVGPALPATTETERNKAFIVEYAEALSGRVKTEALIREYTTSEALIEHVRVFEAAFPCYELLIDDLIAEGDKVATRVRARGRVRRDPADWEAYGGRWARILPAGGGKDRRVLDTGGCTGPAGAAQKLAEATPPGSSLSSGGLVTKKECVMRSVR